MATLESVDIDIVTTQYLDMAVPGEISYVTDQESYATKRKRELREMAMSAKKAGEEWGRRWHLSLALGNAAALAAIASGTLSILTDQPSNGLSILRWVLIPSAWVFATGLVSGSVLPYCWKKKVERIGEWVDVRIDEINENGPVCYPTEDDEGTYSDELLAIYDKHQKRWSKILDICELTAVGSFLLGLVWVLLVFSTRSFF